MTFYLYQPGYNAHWIDVLVCNIKHLSISCVDQLCSVKLKAIWEAVSQDFDGQCQHFLLSCLTLQVDTVIVCC